MSASDPGGDGPPPVIALTRDHGRWGSAAELAARVGFGVASALLALAAAGLMGVGVWRAAAAVGEGVDALDSALIGAVGSLIVAVAIFDVARYLLEEEVIRAREMRDPAEARRSLTKFISTILVAIFMDGLVTLSKVSRGPPVELLYPALLFLVGGLVMVALGVFQRLSAAVESATGERGNGPPARGARDER